MNIKPASELISKRSSYAFIKEQNKAIRLVEKLYKKHIQYIEDLDRWFPVSKKEYMLIRDNGIEITRLLKAKGLSLFIRNGSKSDGYAHMVSFGGCDVD